MLYFFGRLFRWLGNKNLLNYIDDGIYLRICYYLYMGKPVNFSNPITLNQKINWLKINDRKEKYVNLVDKYRVKEYVTKLIGSEYIIPTIGVWNSFDEINFDILPDKFVLKCTHDSGSVIICADKNNFNFNFARKKLSKCLMRNYYWFGREWVYKNIKPCIIAEQYIQDYETHDLKDYKFYCFGNVVDCVLVCVGRGSGQPKFYFFDREWNLKRYNKLGKQAPDDFTLPKPENIDKMFEIARTLSVASGAPFLRVDLYNVNGKIYFGELTLYPDCGMDRNRLPETDEYFGGLVDLSKVDNPN